MNKSRLYYKKFCIIITTEEDKDAGNIFKSIETVQIEQYAKENGYGIHGTIRLFENNDEKTHTRIMNMFSEYRTMAKPITFILDSADTLTRLSNADTLLSYVIEEVKKERMRIFMYDRLFELGNTTKWSNWKLLLNQYDYLLGYSFFKEKFTGGKLERVFNQMNFKNEVYHLTSKVMNEMFPKDFTREDSWRVDLSRSYGKLETVIKFILTYNKDINVYYADRVTKTSNAKTTVVSPYDKEKTIEIMLEKYGEEVELIDTDYIEKINNDLNEKLK